MRLVLLATFITYSFSIAFATPNLNITSIAKAEDVPFNVNFEAIDYEYGKSIDLIFRDLINYKLDPKKVEDLSRFQKKTHSFLIFKPVYERLKSILAIKNQDSFYDSCQIFSDKTTPYTEDITERINISIDKHCRNIFLKKLKTFAPNINFSSRDLTYFNNATAFFVLGDNQEELISFLKHFKTNALEHEKISNLLLNRFIEFKIKPNPKVLSLLKITLPFNKFSQDNLNLDRSANSYFQEEYNRLIKESQEALEKGESSKAKLFIQSALTFYEKNKKFINTHKAWMSAILTAKTFFYKEKDTEAVELFHQIKLMANKEDNPETLFYLIWPYIINKDYLGMKSIIEKNNFEKNFDEHESKLQYWIAYSYLKNGDTKKASLLFNKIINTSPYSFYSIISLKELANMEKGNVSEAELLSKIISHDEPTDYSIEKISDQLKSSLKRLAVWGKLGNERFATLEIRFIQNLKKDETFKEPDFNKTVTPEAHKKYITINLVKLLNFEKKYIASFKIFQESLEQGSLSLNYKLIKFIFPLNYFDLIKKNAENIDPLIIISLIRQESAFNPDAKSGVGAKGLMQLMPATAKRFNKRIALSHLYNPAINVAIGTRYFRQLVSRFDGNLIFALASYNAGENRIDRWRKEIFRNNDPLTIIESIPFEETRNYVKLIYRNNFFYSLLSNKSVLLIPLEDTFKLPLKNKTL